MNFNLMLAAMASKWDISTFLTNLTNQLQRWGGLVIVLIGTVMIIVAVWKLATGLMKQGQGQTNWFIVLILFLVGGAFVAAGSGGAWKFVTDIAGGGKDTIEGLGKGTIFYGLSLLH